MASWSAMMSLPTPDAARSFDTDFVEKDVAAVTEQLVVVHDEVV